MINTACAVALGFFDGVHIAHQKIIQTAVAPQIAYKAHLCFAFLMRSVSANIRTFKKTHLISS